MIIDEYAIIRDQDLLDKMQDLNKSAAELLNQYREELSVKDFCLLSHKIANSVSLYLNMESLEYSITSEIKQRIKDES